MRAGVAELADAGDLKSLAFRRVGSSPTLGISSMESAVTVLAAFGLAAIVWRSLRALGRLLHREATAFLAREAADARASHGDLTGMADAVARAAEARRTRRRALLELAFWLLLLVVPPWTAWTKQLYAASALLWLFGRAWQRRRGAGVDGPRGPGR